MAGHVVVDGSNIATEGRSLPSLAQLDDAVRAFIAEHPHDIVTVVVDATFAHRIDESEVAAYEEARAAGEVVSPPAGAIGRGDGFLLQIADRANATVLSNDSFQEFHGQYQWLFDEGRLIGGTPVPGVGWIFSFRTPVRGPKSRDAVRKAKQKGKDKDEAAPAPARPRRRAARVAVADEPDDVEAPEAAVVGADDGDRKRRRRRRRKGKAPTDALNDPGTFVAFVAEHLPGSELEGEVESYASHGAYVLAGGARCYLPLTGIADPPPRSARQLLRLGERRSFVVRAIDTPRRGIELALPGIAPVAQPDEELDAVLGADDREPVAAAGGRGRGRRGRGGGTRPGADGDRRPAEKAPARKTAKTVAEADTPAPTRRGRGAKEAAAPAEAAPAARRSRADKDSGAAAPAEAAPAGRTRARKEAAAPAKARPAKAAAAKKAAGQKAAEPAKKAAATERAAATKKAPAKKAAAKKGAAKAAASAKKAAKAPAKSTAKKAPAAKAAPSAKARKAAPAKAAGTRKRSTPGG